MKTHVIYNIALKFLQSPRCLRKAQRRKGGVPSPESVSDGVTEAVRYRWRHEGRLSPQVSFLRLSMGATVLTLRPDRCAKGVRRLVYKIMIV